MTAAWSVSTSVVSPRASAVFTGESGGAVCLGARAGAGAAGRRGRVVRRYGCVAAGFGAPIFFAVALRRAAAAARPAAAAVADRLGAAVVTAREAVRFGAAREAARPAAASFALIRFDAPAATVAARFFGGTAFLALSRAAAAAEPAPGRVGAGAFDTTFFGAFAGADYACAEKDIYRKAKFAEGICVLACRPARDCSRALAVCCQPLRHFSKTNFRCLKNGTRPTFRDDGMRREHLHRVVQGRRAVLLVRLLLRVLVHVDALEHHIVGAAAGGSLARGGCHGGQRDRRAGAERHVLAHPF